MRLYWLWLALHPKLTEDERLALINFFHSPEDLFFAGNSGLQLPDELEDAAARALSDRGMERAEQVLTQCSREGLRILTYGEEAYPRRLKQIPDPPLVLYCKGSLPDLDGRPTIGVVGTRKASPYGLNVARQFGWQLARCGGAVVSGMALGVDAAAMTGALVAGGTVVGVLGCGAEQVYPKANRDLFARMAEEGCILSEYPPGTPPNKWHFPRRNRIISGLSNGVLVVEAPEKSGSLITAQLAAEQGRGIYVVPGNLNMTSFSGSSRLLREGATLVCSGWDVLSEYQELYPGKVRQNLSEMEPASAGEKRHEIWEMHPEEQKKQAAPKKKTVSGRVTAKKDIDNQPSAPYIDLNDILPKLSENERLIVTALRDGERLVDDVIAETGLTTGAMMAAMTRLEIKGLVRRLSGRRIGLK